MRFAAGPMVVNVVVYKADDQQTRHGGVSPSGILAQELLVCISPFVEV